MKIAAVGGGPAGLYFSILLKRARPDWEIHVYERNPVDVTFGFGVVFSDATLDNLRRADPQSCDAILDSFHHWDDIHIHLQGEVLRSTGHGFAGMSRQRLLTILATRAHELGVQLHLETEIGDPAGVDADLIVAADGVNSAIRQRLAEHFEPHIDLRPNRFVWLGTTCPFAAFTFLFKETEHGLWRVHAYQYQQPDGDAPISTFIIEATDQTFHAAGLEVGDENTTIGLAERLFGTDLKGHRLTNNRSVWRQFPTVRNARWHHRNVVLLGDAAHTAHFSVGSGTKMAMEDAIVLCDSLVACGGTGEPDREGVERALSTYEARRRPEVESLQRAAQASLQWFEDTERYWDDEPIQFGYGLLTRSLRITHSDLALRDPRYVARVNAWFASRAAGQSGVHVDEMASVPVRHAPAVHRRSHQPPTDTPPPMFTPFKLRELVLVNRVVVSAMCQYSAVEGLPGEWHAVHLGSRAVGGAGLIMTEMTDVSAAARISTGCAGIYTDEHGEAWRRIVDFVHRNSYAKIGLQLAHAGRKGSTRLAWEGADEPLEQGNWPLLAASPMPWFEHSQTPSEMTRDDMDTVRNDFVAAASRADTAGFDLIELHMAHGYLLSGFISPLTNQRTDEYGGSIANRMRYPLEVMTAVRAAWPPHKPISVRISAVEWAPGGSQPEDAVEVARLLAGAHCDLVDVSAGQTVPFARPNYGRQFQTPFSDRIRRQVPIATMAVGNITSFMDVNTILAAGRADLCALARAHLWDPYWTRHAAHAQGFELPWPDPSRQRSAARLRASARLPAQRAIWQSGCLLAGMPRWWRGSPISARSAASPSSIDGSGLEEEFIAWFWSRRDPDATTPLNEFRAEWSGRVSIRRSGVLRHVAPPQPPRPGRGGVGARVADRLAFVEKEYPEPERGNAGWATARGLIYLLMGPPNEILVSSRRFAVEGALRRLTSWQYTDPRGGARPVRLCLVNTRSGIKLANDPRRPRSANPAEALETARAGLVTNTMLGRFGESSDHRGQSLPLQASTSRRGEGWVALMRLPVEQLFGEPVGNTIQYRLTISARSVVGSSLARQHELGTLQIHLSADDFRDWSDQQIHIAVWTPASTTELRVGEVLTGRTATVSTGSTGVVPEAIAMARKLAVTPPVGDRGTAIAYFPTSPERHPTAVATIIVAPLGSATNIEMLPGGQLALALPRTSGER